MNNRILVVDDEDGILNMLQMYLEFNGFEVDIATSAEEGLRQLKKTKPDLILADVLMPSMTGYDFCEHIKKLDEYKDIPFIFLTATATREDKEKGLGLGAIDFIVKPFDESELLKKLKKILRLDTEEE